jgi:hypothetical protein
MYKDLIRRMSSTDGKTIHTRGMAIQYLSRKRPNEKLQERLSELCEQALLSGNWEPVREYVIRLW